jgi:hypothetical protein
MALVFKMIIIDEAEQVLYQLEQDSVQQGQLVGLTNRGLGHDVCHLCHTTTTSRVAASPKLWSFNFKLYDEDEMTFKSLLMLS